MSDSDTVAAEAPTTDTGTASPAQADTSTQSPPAITGNAGETPAPGTQDQGSLTSGDPLVQNNNTDQSVQDPASGGDPKAPARPVDWEKRYRDQQSWHDRRYQHTQGELQQMRQQLQEQLRWRQEQERKASLPPWSPQHPEGPRFSGLLERAKAMHRQLEAARRLPEDQRAVVEQTIMAGATPEEHEALGKFREAGQNFQQEFFMSQGQNLAPMFAQVATQVFQQMQAKTAGEQQVARDFGDPTIKALLDQPAYKDYLHQQLNNGLPYDASIEMLKLKAANDIMYERLTGSQKAQATAQEQTRLAKGRASQAITPDPAAAPVDHYALAVKEAKARGVPTDSPQFIKLYNRIAGVG